MGDSKLMITRQVGTSFELKQRLQEPLPAASTSLHSFDIEQSPEVLDIWKDLEQRTQKEFERPETFNTQREATISPSGLQAEAIRALHFRATNPPNPQSE